MDETGQAARHYERAGLIEQLRAGLAASGFGDRQLAAKDLAGLDQFHVRGLAATVELGQAIPITGTTRVIDIGSGLGGPSRYLSETYGCSVLGIDLSQSFVDAANYLAQRAGLADKVTYQRGNALSLPFAAGAFEIAWTQHVAMNIADRDGLYREAFRVLRGGGHFAIYDVVAASDLPPHYPVPWASGPETSFLVTADRMRTVLTDQGFRIASWHDRTEAGVTWYAERQRERAQSATPPAFGLQSVMGPEFAVAAGNLYRNLREGRVALIQAICEKP